MRGVHHLDGYTAMVHECGHGILLHSRARVGVWVAVEHVVPVVISGSEIGGERTVIVFSVVAIIRITACASGRPVVIFHELRHSRGHAAHNGFVGVGAGAEVVVRCVLIPISGDERADDGGGLGLRQASGAEAAPLVGNLLRRFFSVLHRHSDGAVIVSQPRTDVVRNLPVSAVVLARIAENRNGAVVTRNHDEASAVDIMEDVEMLHTDVLGDVLENRCRLFWEFQQVECLREILGFHRIDG